MPEEVITWATKVADDVNESVEHRACAELILLTHHRKHKIAIVERLQQEAA